MFEAARVLVKGLIIHLESEGFLRTGHAKPISKNQQQLCKAMTEGQLTVTSGLLCTHIAKTTVKLATALQGSVQSECPESVLLYTLGSLSFFHKRLLIRNVGVCVSQDHVCW